jgi:hypothetical protein
MKKEPKQLWVKAMKINYYLRKKIDLFDFIIVDAILFLEKA